MNNIYKVIWSKAKNCYVVASEIARSHTKSASGSEKIGGGTRRKLLASLMALSLLCGGLGVAEASVHVVESGETYEVLTTQEVKAGYGTKDDVENNKNNIKDLQNTTRTQGQNIATNAANIANNKDDIAKKIDTETANATFATKEELRNLKDTVNGKADESTVTTALADKADKSYVDTAVAGAVTTAGTNVNEKLKDYAKTTYVDTEVGKKANKATTLAGYGITDAYTQGQVDTALGEKADQTALTQATDRITTNENAIDKLKEKTTDISWAAGDGTKISGVTIKDGNIIGNGNSAITGLTKVETDSIKTDSINGKSLTGTNVATEKNVKDVADAVKAETDARKEADIALEGKITKSSENIATLDKRSVKYDTDVKDTITLDGAGGTTITQLKEANLSDSSTDAVTGKQLYKTNVELAAETKARTDKDTELEKGIAKNSGDITALDDKIKTNADNIQTNADNIVATNKRTAGIDRIDATSETTIEKNVTVDNKGNVTAKGKLKGEVVDAGAVNAGSLSVENASTLKGDVTMDKKLSVTGETSLGKTDVGGALTVTGKSDLKGDVTLGTPNGSNTVAVNGTANFNAAVNMANGLNVTNGETNLKKTTVDGNLKVTGTITTDKMVFGDKVNSNYTEIDHGKVTSKNHVVNAAGEEISSSSTFDVEKNEVGFANSITGEQSSHKQTSDVIKDTVKNNTTGDQSFHKQTSDVIMDNVKDGKNSNNRTQTKTETKDIITDENGNSSTTSQTASENKTYLKDKDGNTNSTIDTAKGYDKTIKGENGETSTKQDELNITNTAKDGTITNDAQNIVNKAATMDTTVTGKATESYGELETTVTGQATQNFNGGLDTNVKGTENHTVTGDQNIHVTGKQTNKIDGNQENTIGGSQTTTVEGKVTENYKNGQETTVTGDKKTTVTGNQTTNVTGDILNTAKNITNEANETLTDKVGTNTRVTTSTSIIDTVGTTTNRKIEDGKIIDTANDSTVTTENGKGTTFTKTGSTAFSTAADAPTDTNIAGNHITTGRVDANELGVSDKDGANTADLSVKAGEGVKASAGNGTTTGSLDVTADEVGSSVTDASGKGSTFKQRIDAIMMESKNVSIKADEKLTNEAKVITNKASEVINNEAVNINNTATGTINSKASEIKNQADKLISNKVGENTSEYMEDGKITTSIKDGAKSTVTIQNADGLQTGVTNGTSTNASATTATSSAQTIASGNKANSVITTIDGTQFVNTDAAAPVTGESGAGTADRTTIKGNTITTGKVTMDYADVMKDLGVRGNANINGKTTTGSLEVTGTSTLKGDVTMENNATVGNNLTVNGITTTKTLNVTDNATVGGTLGVTGKATFKDSVSIAKDLTVGGDVTAKSYKVGDKTYISADGINANDQKITNVADGSISEGSKDAVNGGQLYQVKNDLEGKVNKVGANAAAMANLHPMEFDPDSKWNIAAAMGSYGSETATAIGAFYRPNEDVMVNFSTAFGTGENMVGGGVSVRLGKGSNKLSREETNALKSQVDDLTARMDALLSVLNPNMSKDFPDVPENHWAYEAVSRLAGNDIVQGYPDGEFHGERTMTRYEMAEIIYNALSRGAEAERELVEEFKPELQAMAASEKATAERAEG